MRRENNLKKQREYIAGIDGLRAIAVLMVLAYHLRIPAAKGGLLGVTVFFVISGFLITRILISELERGNTVNIKKFWFRRIRRLLPAVLVMAAVIILVSAVFNRVLFTKACSDLPSVVFCYNNWKQIFNNVSYFENAGIPSPFTHCWSLAIEAQFYLAYPILLLFVKKCKNWKRISACVTILLAIISMGAMWILFDPSKDPSRVYYGTDTRVFSLLFGAFLAFIVKDIKNKKDNWYVLKNVIGGAAFAGLLYMMVRVDGYSIFLYKGGQGIASVCTVLVIFSLLDEGCVLNKILNARFLKWIGDRSYGIYLWHYPIILLISNGKKPTWPAGIIEILTAFIISDMSYRFIETPIRRGIIGKSIYIIRRRPRTKREQIRRQRTLKRSIRAGILTLIMAAGVLLCVAFVPRKTALNNIEELEKQAERARKIADQKTLQLKDKIKQIDTQAGAEENLKSDEEILSGLNLLLIGDSVALGATDDFYAAFPGSISDVAVSRHTRESIGIYDTYATEKGWNGDGVIYALGSNGLLNDSLSVMREMIGKDKALFIITVRVPHVSWAEPNNQEIYEFTESTENTYLIDWYKISEGHEEYFAEDGTHLTSQGIDAYVDGIKESVLKVYKEKSSG